MLARAESFLDGTSFRLLNETRSIESTADWNNPRTPKLWLYNLHYQDGLRSNLTATEIKQAVVNRWMADNPPGVGNGWEPYPLSIRIVNWIAWALAGNPLDNDQVQSLATQVRALAGQLEFHLLGNHLWANGKALFFAGLFFGGLEAEHWFNRGLGILNSQRECQFLGDGAHFELSPSYHAIMLEDMLDILNMARGCRVDLDLAWFRTAARALAWLQTMTRADGRTPLFNDSFNGVAPTTAQLMGYGAELGIKTATDRAGGGTFLAASGYYRWDGPDLAVWTDFGRIGPDYIPGHAHADCFSFELECDGQPIIIDTGTSTYEIGSRRAYERGTSAHNTVCVGNLDQAELWGGFRVGRRPDICDLESNGSSIAAYHTGYNGAGVRHMRRFDFAPREIIMHDWITHSRKSRPEVVAHFHFAPGLQPLVAGRRVTVGPVELAFANASAIDVQDCEIAEGFNDLRHAKRLVVAFDDYLTTRIAKCTSSS